MASRRWPSAQARRTTRPRRPGRGAAWPRAPARRPARPSPSRRLRRRFHTWNGLVPPDPGRDDRGPGAGTSAQDGDGARLDGPAVDAEGPADGLPDAVRVRLGQPRDGIGVEHQDPQGDRAGREDLGERRGPPGRPDGPRVEEDQGRVMDEVERVGAVRERLAEPGVAAPKRPSRPGRAPARRRPGRGGAGQEQRDEERGRGAEREVAPPDRPEQAGPRRDHGRRGRGRRRGPPPRPAIAPATGRGGARTWPRPPP